MLRRNKGGIWPASLPGRARPYAERVHRILHQVGQRLQHETLPRQPSQSHEGDRRDVDAQMGFHSLAIAAMPLMQRAVIMYEQMFRLQRLRQPVRDFRRYWSHCSLSTPSCRDCRGRPALYIGFVRFTHGLRAGFKSSKKVHSLSVDPPRRKPERFHGRARQAEPATCEWPGCANPGEFRAPKGRDRSPGAYHWYCLDHVRAFNAAYNFFDGLTAEELAAAQSGHPAWERPTRPYASNADPARARLDDPMHILRGQPGFARFAERAQAATGRRFTEAERNALVVLGLEPDARWVDVKQRYKEQVRQLHPDANAGDRRHEAALRSVIDAYTELAKSPAFADERRLARGRGSGLAARHGKTGL